MTDAHLATKEIVYKLVDLVEGWAYGPLFKRAGVEWPDGVCRAQALLDAKAWLDSAQYNEPHKEAGSADTSPDIRSDRTETAAAGPADTSIRADDIGRDWREACRLYHVRCSSDDCSRVARLRAYIANGLLMVSEQPSDPATSATNSVSVSSKSAVNDAMRFLEDYAAQDHDDSEYKTALGIAMQALISLPPEPGDDPPGKWSDGGKEWTGSTIIERVYPETLAVTHIFDGEEVVTGGADGQVYIATFASEKAAQAFVDLARKHLTNVTGERRAPTKPEPVAHSKSQQKRFDALRSAPTKAAVEPPPGYRIIPGKGGKGFAWVRGTEYPNEGFDTPKAAIQAAWLSQNGLEKGHG